MNFATRLHHVPSPDPLIKCAYQSHANLDHCVPLSEVDHLPGGKCIQSKDRFYLRHKGRERRSRKGCPKQAQFKFRKSPGFTEEVTLPPTGKSKGSWWR